MGVYLILIFIKFDACKARFSECVSIARKIYYEIQTKSMFGMFVKKYKLFIYTLSFYIYEVYSMYEPDWCLSVVVLAFSHLNILLNCVMVMLNTKVHLIMYTDIVAADTWILPFTSSWTDVFNHWLKLHGVC